MAYLNRISLVGTTVGEVTNRRMESGAPMVAFKLGVGRRGGRDEESDQFACLMYGDRAANVARWMRPGLLVLVEGSVRLAGRPGAPEMLVALSNVIELSRAEAPESTRVFQPEGEIRRDVGVQLPPVQPRMPVELPARPLDDPMVTGARE
jgi:hypothetical protein